MPGILACDIDGTLTNDPFYMDDRIVRTLYDAFLKGWTLIFLTGRPYVWGARPLLALKFPFFLAVINGANLLRMPEKELLEEILIPKSHLTIFDSFCAKHQTDFVAYAGISGNDVCYFRPRRFSEPQMKILLARATGVGENWIPVEDYNEIDISGFASIKCFGDSELSAIMGNFMEYELDLHAPVIRDPLNDNQFVAQATSRECTKGAVLRRFIQKHFVQGPLVVAGDDYNDISMLLEADVRIVMSTAPEELLRMGDMVAPPIENGGLSVILPNILSKY